MRTWIEITRAPDYRFLAQVAGREDSGRVHLLGSFYGSTSEEARSRAEAIIEDYDSSSTFSGSI